MFLGLTGLGLILLPMLLRLLRRAFPKEARRAEQDPSESARFFRLLKQSFLGPLRVLLVVIAIAQATRILIYCFSKTVDWEGWLQVKQDEIFRCWPIVEVNGLSIAFPSQTLYLRQDAGHAADAVASTP